MPASFSSTLATQLRSSPRFQKAREELLDTIAQAGASIQGIRPASAEASVRSEFQSTLQAFQKQRGRDLYFPFIASGMGQGPFVELADGSVKYDMITGIGINFFGHNHPALLSELVDGLPSDALQGNLQPGVEAAQVIEALLARATPGSRLAHAWLMCSGTMVNEVALKIIRQRRTPATRIFAFKDCFAGRSTAMQEITDNPGYRVGQPTYGEVSYLDYYDAALGLEASVARTVGQVKEALSRAPDKYAAIMIELVQGEGGFRFAPREFYVRVFEAARQVGLAIWVDEIQTFGRTGELFAFQKFGLREWVDVVTIGKLSHACAVLYTAEYNPKPGLVAGTFSGSSGVLRIARRTLELLTEPGVQGPEGRVECLAAQFERRLNELKEGPCQGQIGEIRVIGGLVGFMPLDGKLESVKQLLFKLFDRGVIAFYCGHGPYLVRMLPPLMAMEPKHVDEVCDLIGQTLQEMR